MRTAIAKLVTQDPQLYRRHVGLHICRLWLLAILGCSCVLCRTSSRTLLSEVMEFRATAELAEARRSAGEGSWLSIARLSAGTRYETPAIRALAEATFYEGLRKAGVPEE